MNRYGQNYPFGSTTEFLKSYTTIANLEGSIPKVHIPTKINTMVFSFPPETPTILKNNGIQAVSLANNHSLDSGAVGYEETKRSLENGGIVHFGGYSKTLTEHFETHFGTTSVIVYGINMISSTWDKEMTYSATELLRKQYPKSMLIAQLHWGNEYALTQGDEQRVLAHKLIDRGVDVIVGSHPHVVQGIEVYKGAPIFYSLGNFIFDQYFSRDVERGYLLSLDKKEGKILYTIIPIVSRRSQVSLPPQKVRMDILETIAKSSDASLQKNINESEILLPFLR
jgi:poly-gamma-glutamate synthesis protein (capsule biosynthesis protein)